MNVLNKPVIIGYFSIEGTVCILTFHKAKSDFQTSRRFKSKYGKKLPCTFFNSPMTQKIYREGVSVGCSENWSIKNICGKYRAYNTRV